MVKQYINNKKYFFNIEFRITSPNGRVTKIKAFSVAICDCYQLYNNKNALVNKYSMRYKIRFCKTDTKSYYNYDVYLDDFKNDLRYYCFNIDQLRKQINRRKNLIINSMKRKRK